MRNGYWTGFVVGGLLGMLAGRIYGDRLMETVFPGLVDTNGEVEDEAAIRPLKRRRRPRRKF